MGNRRLVLACVLLPSGFAMGAGSSASSNVFVESFGAASQPGYWTLVNDPTQMNLPGATALSAQGLTWSSSGFRVNTDGVGYASAPFSLGTQAFDLTATIHLDKANYAEWAMNGFYIGLASDTQANMGSAFMGSTGISTVWTFLREGPSPALRGGAAPYAPQTTAGYGQYTRWADNDLSPYYTLNSGGQGGHEYSRNWPMPTLDSTDWTVRITRDAGSTLTYSLCYSDYTTPFITKSYTMPASASSGIKPSTTPLEYLVIGKAKGASEYTDTNLHKVSSSTSQMSSWITDIQARTLDTPAPVVTGFSSADTVLGAGSVVTLLGQNLDPNASVSVGGLSATGVSAVPGGVQFTMPSGVPTGQRVSVTVTNANGLHAGLADGVPTGRILTRIDEREARPEGGDVVTLVGGGFDANTVVQINNQPAQVVQLTDSSHLSVRAPAGAAGPATVTVTSGPNTYSGSVQFAYAPHSSMFYRNSTELQALRDKFNAPQFANYKTVILRNANNPDPQTGKYDMNSVLWGYLLTGNAAYKDRLIPMLQTEVQSLDHYQFSGSNAIPVAVAYDALFGELDKGTKMQMQRYLDQTVGLYNQMVASNDWWYANNANPSNTIAIGSSAGGIAGVAQQNYSNASKNAATVAGPTINKYFKALGADGGYVEGSLYWNYAVTSQLVLGHVLQNATGSDQGLLDTTPLRNNVHFVETMLGGNGTMFGFNDSQPWMTGWAISADLGSRFQQPLMLWMADHMAEQFAQGKGVYSENTRGDVSPYAFLFRSTDPAPAQFPGVPVISTLSSLNWGVMRNRGDVFQPELVVGVKGRGGTLTHHHESDLGSFELDSRGERYFIDPGYYRPNGNQHSVPVIDGTAPSATALAPITTATTSGDTRYMVVNTTAAYGAGVQRSQRNYLMIGDKAIILLDDIVPAAGKSGAVQSYFQSGFHADILSGDSFVMQGKNSRLMARLFGPAAISLVDAPQTWNANDWVYNGSGVTWETLSAAYTADPNQPLVSVFLPTDSSGALPSSSVVYQVGYLTISVPGYDVRFDNSPTSGWSFTSATAVPEPAALLTVLIGSSAAMVRRRRMGRVQ